MRKESHTATPEKNSGLKEKPESDSESKELMRIVFFAGNLGFTMVLCIVAGFFAGLWLDKFFTTDYIFLVIFLIAGIGAGFYQCYRLIKKDLKL